MISYEKGVERRMSERNLRLPRGLFQDGFFGTGMVCAREQIEILVVRAAYQAGDGATPVLGGCRS